jgi:hypothetical protein
MIKKLGAKEVFDYTAPSILGDLTDYLKDKEMAGAYDGKCNTQPWLLTP